ncbi:MAG: DUF4423 domain-containing protein [Proteobacteria bacterium]|nr:DUF4423 domain-containing protein [Pseudomonadota bacterium]
MSIFSASCTRDFVKKKIHGERGLRQRLLSILGCQSSFLSQVFAEKSHFSLEHGMRICSFFHLDSSETKFFLTMLQMEKAGSSELTKFFKNQLQEMIHHRNAISSRIGPKTHITEEVSARYYSSWYYAAIHILVAFDFINSKDDLKRYMRLPMRIVESAVEFLMINGLVKMENGSLAIGTANLHVDNRNPFVTRHHLNWRQKATPIIEQNLSENLHYTNIMGISRKDADYIRSKILELIQSIEPVIKNSEIESPYVLIQDFFQFDDR